MKQYEFGRFHGLRMWWRWSTLAEAIRFVLFVIAFFATVLSIGALVMGFVAVGALLFGDTPPHTGLQALVVWGFLGGGLLASVASAYALFKLVE
jgi:hypothetical protein